MTTTERFDPYQAVTEKMITLLEQGTAPWRKPWATDGGSLPLSLSTGKPYRGVNVFLLNMAAYAGGYNSPYWATYKKITELGGQVRKGEKSTMIVFWKTYLDKKELGDDGKPKQRFVLRVFNVFNTEQADAQEGKTFRVPAMAVAAPRTAVETIEQCEAVVTRYLANGGPVVRFGGARACYSPTTDDLSMPERDTFTGSAEFYSTYFHELTHSTGHANRLNRKELASFSHFGDRHYSKEELVAEMGAAFLAGVTGILPSTVDNSAAYLASWIKALKGDPKLVVQAAAQAQKAADLVLGVSYAAAEETAA